VIISTMLHCLGMCVYVSVAYVLQKHFHRQHQMLQHLQVQMQHQMKIQNATATLAPSYIVELQEDLRKHFKKLHQDETTAQRGMRLDFQQQIHNVSSALHRNLQMMQHQMLHTNLQLMQHQKHQIHHQMQLYDITSDVRNLSAQSILLNSNIIQVQRDLKTSGWRM